MRRNRRSEEQGKEGSRKMEEGYKRTREKDKDINIVEEMMVFLTGETKDLNLVIKLN